MDLYNRYSRELLTVQSKLKVSPEDSSLLDLKEKLERIVALLQTKLPVKKKSTVPEDMKALTVGTDVEVSVEGVWKPGQIFQICLPDHVLVSVADIGRTIKIEDFQKKLRFKRKVNSNIYSNPQCPVEKKSIIKLKNTSTSSKRKKNVEKEAELEAAANERKQSWMNFNAKKVKK